MNHTATRPRGNTPSSVPSKVNGFADDVRDVPPSDLEAERCVLGCLLLANESMGEVSPIVDAACFYADGHRRIFRTFTEMFEAQGGGIDAVTLRDELTRRGELDEVGGVTYLLKLLETVPHAEHAAYYGKIVREKSDQRRALEVSRQASYELQQPGADTSAIVAGLAEKFQALGEGGKGGRTFAGIGSDELAGFASMEADWLVQDVFTIDEPLMVGARSKCCKTLQLVDLAIALATGTPWMGTFEVPKRRRVLFISGETNNRRMAKHIANACRARGFTFADLGDWLRVECNEFPSLPSASDLAAIRRTIERHGIEVVIADPLYRGMAGVDGSQLFEMGDALKNFQTACRPACAILSHHSTKTAAREYGKAPSLEDMAGAGVAEFAGQAWRVGRNEPYAWDGRHDLCVEFGGREGQAGGRRILFDERAWTFEVEHLADYIEGADEDRRTQQETAKREAEDRKLNQARLKIISACRNVKTPQSRTRIRDASGQSGVVFGKAFADLVQEQSLLPRTYRDGGNRIQPEGYILTEYADDYDQKWGAE